MWFYVQPIEASKYILFIRTSFFMLNGMNNRGEIKTEEKSMTVEEKVCVHECMKNLRGGDTAFAPASSAIFGARSGMHFDL